MFDYIIKVLEELPSDMGGTSKKQAANHRFMTNEKCDILGKDKAKLFQLLYLCWHTRQDIQTAVAFLCTRVKRPDKDHYKNSLG